MEDSEEDESEEDEPMYEGIGRTNFADLGMGEEEEELLM